MYELTCVGVHVSEEGSDVSVCVGTVGDVGPTVTEVGISRASKEMELIFQGFRTEGAFPVDEG